MKLLSQSVDTLMTEELEVTMHMRYFTKIVRAQVVEMKVGNTEFETATTKPGRSSRFETIA